MYYFPKLNHSLVPQKKGKWQKKSKQQKNQELTPYQIRFRMGLVLQNFLVFGFLYSNFKIQDSEIMLRPM